MMNNLRTLQNALNAFDTNMLTPYTIGYDRSFDRLLNFTTQQLKPANYPPYNIRKTNDFSYVIEMAIAGFSKGDIDIQIADGVLSVKSIKKDKDEEDLTDESTYHGISNRGFSRKFSLADDIIVNDASLQDGMLTIFLERIVPEEKKPRSIKIK